MTGAGCGHLQDDGKRRRQRHWCRVLLRGLRTEYGPWNTIAMSRRSCRKSRAELWVMWRSSNSTRPPVGSSRRVMSSRPVVVCRGRTPRPATMSPRHPEQHRGRIRQIIPGLRATLTCGTFRRCAPGYDHRRSTVERGATGGWTFLRAASRTHGARCCAPSWPRLPHCRIATRHVPGPWSTGSSHLDPGHRRLGRCEARAGRRGSLRACSATAVHETISCGARCAPGCVRGRPRAAYRRGRRRSRARGTSPA